MQKVSKGFYVGSIAGAGSAGLLLTIIANIITLDQGPNSGAAAGFLLPGILLSIYAGIVSLILWYKAWEAIQDGNARTTPGKAIGFLFIPFYGFYWIFQAYWGFAQDYNAYIKRHKVATENLPEGLFLTNCILAVAGILVAFIPIFSSLFSLVSYTIWILIIIKLCNALNGIAQIADKKKMGEPVSQAREKGEPKTSGMAIASLVLSCAGLLIGIFGAIPGLILGIISLKAINKSQGKLTGKGMAIAGISAGGFFLVMGIFVLASLIPTMSVSNQIAKNTASLTNMQVINTAVLIYELDKGKLPQDLSELTPDYLENIPTDSWGNNYVYTVIGPDEFEIYSLGPDCIAGSSDDVYFVE